MNLIKSLIKHGIVLLDQNSVLPLDMKKVILFTFILVIKLYYCINVVDLLLTNKLQKFIFNIRLIFIFVKNQNLKK